MCIVEEARLKVQYNVIGEQLKAVKVKKQAVMQRLRDAAVGGGECRRCQMLAERVETLNLQLATTVHPQAAAIAPPRRAQRRRRTAAAANEDVEPSSDGYVRIVGEDAS